MATHADVSGASSSTPIRPKRPPSAGSSTTATRSCCIPMRASCRDGGPPGRRGTWTRPLRPAGRAVTMTYHMNRLQSLPGPVDYFVSVNPGDRVRDERVILARSFEPSAVHRPDARVAGRDRAAPGPSRNLVCGRASRVRVPRGRLPLGVRGREADRRGRRGGRGMRSHLLEGTVAHRRVRPVGYALRARRLLPRPGPRGARRGRPTVRPVGRNRRNLARRSGTTTTGRCRRRTSARRCSSTCAPRARTRPAGGSRW